jgi:hypothetical protein
MRVAPTNKSTNAIIPTRSTYTESSIRVGQGRREVSFSARSQRRNYQLNAVPAAGRVSMTYNGFLLFRRPFSLQKKS